MKKLILVGGGHSHLAVITKLGLMPLNGVHVILISRDKLTPYSGMLPGLIAGHYHYEEAHIDLEKLCHWANIEFIHDDVTAIHPEQNTLSSRKAANTYDYDWLSINIGSSPDLSTIAGAQQHGFAVKPIDQFLTSLKALILKIEKANTTFIVNIIGGGVASIEVVLAIQHYLKQQKPTCINKAKFRLICSPQTLLEGHNSRVQSLVLSLLKDRHIEVLSGCTVTSANQNQLILDNGNIIKSDAHVWAIHAGSQAWLKESGITCNKNGFITVNQYLQSTSHHNIFAAGDIIDFKQQPLAKSGVYAVREGPMLANNLYQAIDNKELKAYHPQQHFLRLIMTGNKKAIASKGSFNISGRWVWYWKNYIDRSFIKQYQRFYQDS